MLLLKMKSVKTSDYFLPCIILSTFPPSLQFNKMLVFILTSKDSEVHNFKSTAVGSDSFQYYTVTIILNNKKHNKAKSIQLWLLHIIFLSALSRYLLLTVISTSNFPLFFHYISKRNTVMVKEMYRLFFLHGLDLCLGTPVLPSVLMHIKKIFGKIFTNFMTLHMQWRKKSTASTAAVDFYCYRQEKQEAIS